MSVSIRSPHRSKGRRHHRARQRAMIDVSIRSPHRSKGRQLHPARLAQGSIVSIRSPHRSKGRLIWMPTRRALSKFQSAPLTEARGDVLRCSWRPHLKWFQSAPLTEARGDLSAGVSGRCHPVFQSAPLTEARGDGEGRSVVHRTYSFNPLPSPKQGETFIGCTLLPLWPRRFNPLPSPKQGETLVAITSGITKTYTGTCAIRSNSCQECPTRLPRNAITYCYAGSFQLRESKGKTPSLHFRARYKTSGSFKSTGSPTP